MSSYTEGQIHQLAERLEKEGFTPDEVTKLGQFNELSNLRGIFRGTHEIRQIKNVIDCYSQPFCPDKWELAEYRQLRQFKWDASKIQLYLSEKQKSDKRPKGNELYKELKNRPIINANVLDYLLKNPQFIPKEWKGKYVFFWGTIYRDSSDRLVVRCLYRSVSGWNWGHIWLGHSFGDNFFAALLTSQD